jgi:hypothetical protein
MLSSRLWIIIHSCLKFALNALKFFCREFNFNFSFSFIPTLLFLSFDKNGQNAKMPFVGF